VIAEEISGFSEGKCMAKVIFKFFEVNVNDEDIDLFIEKMEEVLKRFAGEAYHFRHDIETFANGGSSMPQRNSRGTHNGGRYRF
jgi:hypothetical protein